MMKFDVISINSLCSLNYLRGPFKLIQQNELTIILPLKSEKKNAFSHPIKGWGG